MPRCFRTDEQKKEYYRLYYLKNKQRIKRKVKKYQDAHREEKIKYDSEYYDKNIVSLREKMKERYEKSLSNN
jgi:hypothetical protein